MYAVQTDIPWFEDWLLADDCSQITEKLVFVACFLNNVLFMFVNKKNLQPLLAILTTVGHENTFSFEYGFLIALCSEHFELIKILT